MDDPVAVVWRDSANVADGGWTDRLSAISAGSPPIRTVGYLIASSDDVIVLAHSLDDAAGTVAGAVTIPRCSVVTVTTLVESDRAAA